MTQKRKDEYQQMNKVKFNQMCPYYAYELPCINMVLRSYCCYEHNRYARRAERAAVAINDRGEEITEFQI